MHLYSGSTADFVSDATRSRMAAKLADAFEQHFRYPPSQSEVHSWQNSLRAMSSVVELAALDDNGIVVELQLPLTSRRLDCLITGDDDADTARAVIVELKQWNAVGVSYIEDCVTTFVGGRERDVLHPSRQVGNYKRYLQECTPHSARARSPWTGAASSTTCGSCRRRCCSTRASARYSASTPRTPATRPTSSPRISRRTWPAATGCPFSTR